MPAESPGLIAAGTAVILTGEWLEAARSAALIAARDLRRNGLPDTAYRQLADTVTSAMSASVQSDVRTTPDLQHFSQQKLTVPVKEAARRLSLCERHTRRRAAEFGGKRIGPRRQWLLDEDLIDEYLEGHA